MIHTARQAAKFTRLVRALRQRYPALPCATETIAVGLLESLWHFTISNAQRGDVGRFDDDTIAEACGWFDDSTELVTLLVATGWLDECDENRLVIHDWQDHAPGYIKRNIDRKGGFACAIKRPLNCSSEYGSARLTAQVSTEADTPNKTKQNITKPNQTISCSADAERPPATELDGEKTSLAKEPYPADFSAWWEAYPRKVGKQSAAAEYHRAKKRIAAARANAVEWLLEVTQRFARSPAGNAGEFTPHPTTWLKQGRYDDDPNDWQRKEKNGDTRAIGPGQRFDPNHQPDWR